jgi:hypothetical protein
MPFPMTVRFTPAQAACLSDQLSTPDLILAGLTDAYMTVSEQRPYPLALARAEAARLWSQIRRTKAAWLRNPIDFDVLMAAFTAAADCGRATAGMRCKLKALMRVEASGWSKAHIAARRQASLPL